MSCVIPETPPVTVLIPAHNEATRIADTVTAARALPGVTQVLVVDDGSTDDTAVLAEAGGAMVLRQMPNGGKGAALRAGLAACPTDPHAIILLLDADLGASAAEAAALLIPVLADEADLTIARFPKPPGKAGFGLVKGLARGGTWLLTGRTLQAPISGQRAARRWVLDAAPIADGYGVEVAMNVAAGDAGARIVEVPVEMTHAHTGRTVSGFRHRGRQFAHIFAALLAAAFGRTGERCACAVHPGRAIVWMMALAVAGFWLAARTTHLHSAADFLTLFWLVLGAFVGMLLPPLASGLLRARRKNYAGRFIPALGGCTLLPVCLVLLVLASLGIAPKWEGHLAPVPFSILLPVFLLGWLVLGLVDDVAGNADRRGFRGHLTALAHGKLTTGGMKLLGGGLLALATAVMLRPDPLSAWPQTLLAAALIALSANALNLFDLRPGRALKVFWLAALPLLWFGSQAIPTFHVEGLGPWGILPMLAILLVLTVLYAPFDFGGYIMLGDTGANPLGAFLGLFFTLVLPLPGQIVVMLLLISLHVYAERASITRLIERVGALRWLDRLGRSDG